MTPFAVVCGIGVGAGLLVIVNGYRTSAAAPSRWSRPKLPTTRTARTVAAAIIVLALTGWPVAALGAAALAWWASDLLAGNRSTDQAVDRTEAIAAWTEMLRDTMSAAHGLESAITATAPVAPRLIQTEIETLATRLTFQPLDSALLGLADDLDHPIGDLIVAALVSASRSAVRDLAALLGSLAATARDEATMQLRVAAARARTHTAVRVIAGCTTLTAAGLVVLNPSYVDVYADVTGQTVLAIVIGCWALALWWLSAMSRFDQPERFLATSPEVTP